MNKLKTLFLLICLTIPFALVACENKNKNTLSTPTNLSVVTGNIIFDEVDDAEYYTISINDTEIKLDSKYSNNVKIVDNQIHYNASKIFVIGESYSVKVKANSKEKADSSYCEPCSYKHIGNITKPENVKISGTVLTWDPVENASYYLVKIITPTDNYILSKDGTLITKLDATSIQNADLTEYSFYTNYFKFNTLLSNAGEYNFYVSAVHSEIGSYVESGYTDRVTYKHYINLTQPINGIVAENNGSLYLTTIIDDNTKILKISCGITDKVIELNGSESKTISLVDNEVNNFYKINLSNLFSEIDFEELKQYSFTVQSIPASKTSYFTDSNISQIALYEKTKEISTPTITLNKENVDGNYIVSWYCKDNLNVSQYTVTLYTAEGVKELSVENSNSMIITEPFIGVAVKAKGKGNYTTSKLSDVLYPTELTTSLETLSSSVVNNKVVWNSIADYYIVEFKNTQIITTNASFDIPIEKLSSNNFSIKIISVKDGFIPSTNTLNLQFNKQLQAPIISAYQGFNSVNLYELTFTGVENAIGYYVYIKNSNSDYRRINTLFTSTKINLTNEIISKGEYSKYTVRVQAVADPFSIYSNSALSSREVSVTHAQILSTPTFNKMIDENGKEVDMPIIKASNGKYWLKFSGVQNAIKYEILINNNLKVEESVKNWYEIDVSDYLVGAGLYTIKVRALPNLDSTAQPSAYAIGYYNLKQQLDTVSSVTIKEKDGLYTLSFTPVDNAQSYRIRIVKENDYNYANYLKELGLSISFEVDQATDVTAYIKQYGIYYFYVTALAQKSNGYYIDSFESAASEPLNKLETLEAPKEIDFDNKNKTEYMLSWTGDDRADYYRVRLFDPNKVEYEVNVFNKTSLNINPYMTIQGEYSVMIYSMIDSTSENSKYYTSSSYTNATEDYTYKTDDDFTRYSVYMYGENYDFKITNVTQLKNILWYHYLYNINAVGLTFKIELVESSTLREQLIKLAEEADYFKYYNFANDEKWQGYISNPQSSNNELAFYLCKKLIEIYPEYNILTNFNLQSIGNQIFNLSYENALNTAKITDKDSLFTNANYGNDYKYIEPYSRKSSTGVFKIDSKSEMFVTTTEQLLHAVTHNKKPRFIGDSSVAEAVYKNAKLVLSTIVSNNMTDLQKVTAIFDWLEYGFDLVYYNLKGVPTVAGAFEKTNLETYGLNDIYYLESILGNISMSNNGNLVIENNFATSKSYSKAFALLCGIEGINSNLVYGSYNYETLAGNFEVEHVWNVVKVDSIWYSLDLTLSDNRIYYNNLNSGYGISSHSHFLKCGSTSTDNSMLTAYGIKDLNDNNHIIYSSYPSSESCSTDYNYYKNSQFGLTLDQINSAIIDFEIEDKTTDFKYTKSFDPNELYQEYAQTTSQYGEWQSYALNMLIYAEYMANKNSNKMAIVEFSFDWADNNGSSVFDVNSLLVPYDFAKNNYGLDITLQKDSDNQSWFYKLDNSTTQSSTIVFIVKTA